MAGFHGLVVEMGSDTHQGHCQPDHNVNVRQDTWIEAGQFGQGEFASRTTAGPVTTSVA